MILMGRFQLRIFSFYDFLDSGILRPAMGKDQDLVASLLITKPSSQSFITKKIPKTELKHSSG